ncbi:MAG TPA: hypothetical protein VK254_04115 [Candidatus Bathyarchaeia archaeon]|nr:hypothetical protein [Candidatus Bathyarchaeia archaeon]
MAKSNKIGGGTSDMTADEKNPLTEGDLEGAAYLCLASAAFTDLSHPLGNSYRLRHHERKRRFKQALLKLKEGVSSLLELGLLPEDCQWATGNADQIKDSEGWLSRFQEAEKMLREAH